MKKCGSLVILLMVIAISVVWAKGTYRIYTGSYGWYVEQVSPPNEYKRAEIVPRFRPENPWDSWSYDTPRPWYKLYLRENAYWISWTPETTMPGAWPQDMWAYSPVFKMYDNISRATIWISVDDAVDMVLLKNVDDGTCIDLGIYSSGRSRLHRFDVTDQFRSCSAGGSHPPHQLEFFVNDMSYNGSIGLIAYMSYDFDEETGGTDPTTYVYDLGEEGTLPLTRYISMPFYALEPSPGVAPTLRNLFPCVYEAYTYNSSTGEVNQELNIDAPLRGQVGDSVRTFALKLRIRTTSPTSCEIEGWPVFEQRYLDFNTNNTLWFGSVTHPSGIRFSGTYPDDYPEDKILGTQTWEYWGADGGTELNPNYPTNFVQKRYAYKSIPDTGPGTLPYSLDIVAKYRSRSSDGGSKYELSEPVRFPHIGPEFDELYLPDTIYSSAEDTAALIAYYEELRRIEFLPGLPGLPEFGFSKRKTEDVDSPEDFTLSVYPTPFNSEVSVTITIPEDGELSFRVFDNNGKLVRDLYNGDISSGIYSFSWNGIDNRGKNVPSGIYYFRAISSGKSLFTKAVLLK